MRILLAGGCGFIGTNLGKALVNSGHQVDVVGRQVTPSRQVPGIRYNIGNLDDPSTFSALIPKCSHIVYLASATTPSSSRQGASVELTGNLVPLLKVLDALKSHPEISLLFISSGGAIYGSNASENTSENTIPAPVSHYAAGKLASEAFLHAHQAQTGSSVTVIRPSNVYGPGQYPQKGFGVIPALLQCAAQGLNFDLWGDGKNIRDYLFIDDFAELCLRVIESTAQQSQGSYSLFNAGSGEGHSILEIFEEVKKITGKDFALDSQPSRGFDVREITLDNRTVSSSLGWKPSTSLTEGLTLTWDWFRAHCL